LVLIKLLNSLQNLGLNGIIIQDLGIFYILKEYFPDFEVHASTQVTTHNKGQIEFLKKLNVKRVNLSRELNINEITKLTKFSHENNIETEVFVHGSYCISFSGICYMSSFQNGKSGNRGQCSQPCRSKYLTTKAGSDFPLNMKDNSAFNELKDLYDANIDSVKIEGRIKKFHYVYTVIKKFREQLNSIYSDTKLSHDKTELYKVFNRDFSAGYLNDKIDKDMFIENPRDNSAKHFAEFDGYKTNDELEYFKVKLFNEKTEIINKININSIKLKIPSLSIVFNGKVNENLKIDVFLDEKYQFSLFSRSKISGKGRSQLSKHTIEPVFRILNTNGFKVEKIDVDNLQKNMFINFKELKSLKNEIIIRLNNIKKVNPYFELPKARKHDKKLLKNKLSVLISDEKDLNLTKIEDIDLFFKLPDSLKENYQYYVKLFKENKSLIPWFESILIGEDYNLAVKLIEDIKPKIILTNNTGIAFTAYKKNIKWIAGPYLNITNSYSLKALKENFNCSSAFISSELDKKQIKNISIPLDFELYYTIYAPVTLMTTRQCFFHTVIGCEKHIINKTCISKCRKQSSITDLKGNKTIILKDENCYHRIYSNKNLLDIDVINDFNFIFSNFLIDLSNIKTDTTISLSNKELTELFKDALRGDERAVETLKGSIDS